MDKAAFLARIRSALHRHAGEPAEAPPALLAPLPAWDQAALLRQFKLEHEAVGGHVHLVANLAEARQTLQQLIETLKVRRFIATCEPIVDELLVALTIAQSDNPAAADVGISGVRYAIANTGTLVLTSETGRKAPLLPMHHIAIVKAEQLVPSMAEALEHYLHASRELPSAWVQATGPSRTADIELTLTTGVHGPGVVHVIVITT
jgi:L-lactate dehydrogenase complex protein LldG